MGHHHHHHAHHHHQQQLHYTGYGAPPPPNSMQPYSYGSDPYAYPIQPPPYASPHAPYYRPDQPNHAITDRHRHGRNEHIAEVGTLAAGALAMYEVHEAKVDPAHAGRHKLEAGAAGAVALGSAAYAFHEHQEKRKDERLIASVSGHSSSHHGHGHHHNKHEEHHHRKHHNFW